MGTNNLINILIAEDNRVSRELMVGILKPHDFNVLEAENGDQAVEIVKEKDVDLAIVDINMSPMNGFEFVRYLLLNGIDCPVVVVTADDSSDLLIEATSMGVVRVLQKPIQPKRLNDTVMHILKRRGLNPDPLGVAAHDTQFSPEKLMRRAIELAEKNYVSTRGGPYGAVIADDNGKILGEGVNGNLSRSDPTAHAEVMAIRQAAERLNSSDLGHCTLYISSEPTMMGKALIISVGIKKVYVGLSHDDIKSLRASEEAVRQAMHEGSPSAPDYETLGHQEAMDMFQGWIKQRQG